MKTQKSARSWLQLTLFFKVRLAKLASGPFIQEQLRRPSFKIKNNTLRIKLGQAATKSSLQTSHWSTTHFGNYVTHLKKTTPHGLQVLKFLGYLYRKAHNQEALLLGWQFIHPHPDRLPCEERLNYVQILQLLWQFCYTTSPTGITFKSFTVSNSPCL